MRLWASKLHICTQLAKKGFLTQELIFFLQDGLGMEREREHEEVDAVVDWDLVAQVALKRCGCTSFGLSKE
jgi:hypothetical protein